MSRIQGSDDGGPVASDASGARRMRSKVFGVGLPRTGTTSLAAAMIELGYRTCHSCFDDALFDRGDAFFDTPVYVDYPQLDRRYPGSRFILTWRDPAQWYASFSRRIGFYLNFLRTATDLSVRGIADRRCYLQMFGMEGLSEGPFITLYCEHRRRVEEYFRDRPGDLAVIELDALEDPWGEICRFLGEPLPSAPFPRHNVRSANDWIKFRHENKLPSR